MFSLLVALALAAPPAGHDAANPLYRDLLAAGVGGAKLPAPTLPDGLGAAEQRKRIDAAVGADYPWDEFTRQSAVAPFLLRLGDAPAGSLKTLDLWFVLYGPLEATDDPAFLDRILTVGRQGGSGKELTAADLTKRNIPAPKAGEGREQFGRVEFDILDRVRLSATGRVVWSRTPESVVAAAILDPRFVGDAEYPNVWRPLRKGGAGLTAGEPQPYRVAAFTMKVTKLASPAGALFAEQHVVFEEPSGWFDGANLLRSKLPPVVQGQVRSMRREWAKGK